MTSVQISELRAHVGTTVTLRGWVVTTRSSGKIAFVVIRDGSGVMQGVLSKKEVPEAVWEAFGTLTHETSLALTGVVREEPRAPGGYEMTVTGLERIVPALGIDKLLEQGVPQATLDRVAPGVKTQDLNTLFGALDKAVPGLGKVIKQNAGTGVAITLSSIGKEAVLEGKRARSFPLRFADGAVMFGPVKVGQVPPLF